MAVAVSDLILNFDTYIGDASNDRVSAADRYQLLTEATVWLQEETGNDHVIKTYTLPYYDSVHYYKVTTATASLLEGADLRRAEEDQTQPFRHTSSREVAEIIGRGYTESSWAIERRDANSYLAVNHESKYRALDVISFDSISDDGTWTLDEVDSDASNLTVDTNEFKEGSGCFNFDIVVAQSVSDYASMSNSTLTARDLTEYEDLATWIFWIYIPDATHITSMELYWGSTSVDYWQASVTTDINGNAWASGWNRVGVRWSDATLAGTPDVTAITFLRFDIDYSGAQGDDTDFRIDDLKLVRPENLTFFYTSSYVGATNSGTNLFKFSATTDVPYYSGQYDQYKYAVAHKAASLAFYGPLRSQPLGALHEAEAIKAKDRVKRLIPVSVTKESPSFKVTGINFNRGKRLRL